MMNHTLNHIKNITSVDMDIRLSVVMMMNTVNQIYEGENDDDKFIERTLNKVKWCQKTN